MQREILFPWNLASWKKIPCKNCLIETGNIFEPKSHFLSNLLFRLYLVIKDRAYLLDFFMEIGWSFSGYGTYGDYQQRSKSVVKLKSNLRRYLSETTMTKHSIGIKIAFLSVLIKYHATKVGSSNYITSMNNCEIRRLEILT